MLIYVPIVGPTHTHSQSTYMLTETHTVQPLFFVVFLLCSDCVRVLCWSNSQTTVGALFVPSLLCNRYEGSPLCDQKTFLSLLSHSEPVWARVLTQEQPKCHLSLMFGVPVSVTQQCGADLMLSFLLCVWCLLFFFLQTDKDVKNDQNIFGKIAFFILNCMLKHRLLLPTKL